MKKFVMMFLITLLTTTASSSQTILTNKDSTVVIISPQQLKETNLIFVEHQKLLIENKLLYDQINNYKIENQLLVKSDSLRIEQINNYELISQSYKDQINNLNRQIKKSDKRLLWWKVGGITVSTGLLLFLLLK